jgi:site-specific recombinase XerC
MSDGSAVEQIHRIQSEDGSADSKRPVASPTWLSQAIMANLYKPTYTRTDPETGEKSQHKLSKWYGKYRDANGKLRRAALSEDKTAAMAMLSELIRKAHWQAAGLVDPAAEHLERSVGAHVDDFKTHLEAKARSEKHISETIRVINNVVAEIRCDILADLQDAGERLEKHLAQRRRTGASHRTINADLVAVRSFCRWLIGRKRMQNDPTAGLERLNEDEDPRLERRALTDAEAQLLITTTYQSKRVVRNLTGQDRANLYLLAQRTGLRRNELRSLTPQSFDFTKTPPTVTVRAANSKRRRIDVLPLPTDAADAIQDYIAGRRVGDKIWAGSWWEKSAKMLRQDLTDAGISPVDEQGRVVDFHGQRTTFITGLARAGVSVSTAQKLARHSDVNLTLGTYTRHEITELADAVGKLPKIAMGHEAFAAKEKGQLNGELERVVIAWPNLTDEVRAAVLKLVDNGEEGVRNAPLCSL